MPGRESRAVSIGLQALVILTLETRACCVKHHLTQHFIPSWYQNPNSWDNLFLKYHKQLMQINYLDTLQALDFIPFFFSLSNIRNMDSFNTQKSFGKKRTEGKSILGRTAGKN